MTIKVDTEKAMESLTFYVYFVYGSSPYYSNIFSVEVFTCESIITTPSLSNKAYIVQKDSGNLTID